MAEACLLAGWPPTKVTFDHKPISALQRLAQSFPVGTAGRLRRIVVDQAPLFELFFESFDASERPISGIITGIWCQLREVEQSVIEDIVGELPLLDFRRAFAHDCFSLFDLGDDQGRWRTFVGAEVMSLQCD